MSGKFLTSLFLKKIYVKKNGEAGYIEREKRKKKWKF